MRVIGSLLDEKSAQRLSAFLTEQGIENRAELIKTDQGSSWQIWILDEDRIQDANEYLARFLENPTDSLFNVSVEGPIEENEKEENKETPVQRRAIITSFFLALCAFVFLLNFMQEINMRRTQISEEAFIMTPLQGALLYDLPSIVERFEAFITKHQIQPKQTIDDLSPAAQLELSELQKTPYWRGFYEWVLLKIKTGDGSSAEGPLFIKIRQGEVWRLFSPCVLHRDLLHILFNMIWLWVLGRQVEQRIGWGKTLVLTLIVGVFSNTVQYLMSGPFFLGYSGVVMGLAGFIWMRERHAPWEGYPLQRATILFLAFFVLAMFVLQSLSFFVQIMTDLPFVLSIANSAHIAGAIIGALLGRLSFFAWRMK